MRLTRGLPVLLLSGVHAAYGQTGGTAVVAAAQQPPRLIRRFEVGGQIADIRTGCVGRSNCDDPSFGMGLGGSFHFNPHFALDVLGNVTPSSSRGETNVSGGRASELLAGVRAEVRSKHYGYFVKAQPGVFGWSHVITQVSFPTPTTFVFTYGPRRWFVADVGAGLEYSPSARVHVRAEVTDLVRRYSSSSWNNNLQPMVGVYYGVGRVVPWKPPVYRPREVHGFFDRTNVVLLTGAVLGTTADAVTTQRLIARGLTEGDPFARPLVKYGWSGQISLMAIEVGAETLGMYGLHRMGQHWIERLLPVGTATTHAVFAYNNTNIR